MSNRSNVTVGVLALAATLVVIPASMALVRDSIKARQAIAALRVPTTFEIRGSHILDPAMYYGDGSGEESATGVRLVSVVSNRAQAEAVLRVWESLKVESVIRRAGMTVLLSGIGDERALGTMAREGDVAVNYVKNSEEFAIRTGIRVVPFSLIIARGGSVLAAGPGVPDASFIRDAAERFIREGQGAATQFRRVTLEINSGLAAIDATFPADAGGR